MFLKLSLMLEMGSLVAAPLPLIIPFLVVSILGDKILASVAWHQSLMRASSLQGIVRMSILITGCRMSSMKFQSRSKRRV